MGKVIDKHTGRVGDENTDHILGIKIHCRSGTSHIYCNLFCGLGEPIIY